MKKVYIISAIAAVLGLASCKTQTKTTAKNECADVKPGFMADIKPIIDNSCANTCHSAANHKHGIDLSTYELVKASASDKAFLGSIRHQLGFRPMPMKASKLDDVTIQKIGCWIRNGMPK